MRRQSRRKPRPYVPVLLQVHPLHLQRSVIQHRRTDARTLPPSPRSPSPDVTSRSPRRSSVHSRRDSHQKKLMAESRRTMDRPSTESREVAHRRFADRSGRHRRQQIEPSFRFRDALPETPEPRPIRSSSERRSFLQLLESEED